MPSIGFGLGSPMGRLSAQDMGVPDYVKALSSGLSLGAKPAQLTEQLLGQTLQNKINQAKAQYAQRNEAANLAHTQAGTGLTNLNIEKIRNEMIQQQQLNDLLGGGSGNVGSPSGAGRPGYMTPHGFEGSLNGIPAESNYSNTGEDRETEDRVYQNILRKNAQQNKESFIPSISLGQKISQGISSGISSKGNTPADRMKFVYDNYPQFRAGLKKMGYEPAKDHVLTGAARDAESMKQLEDKYGRNSEIYKNAEAMNKYKLQQQEDLHQTRERQLKGLKPGDTPIVDPNTGETIGFNKQTTEKQKEMAKNTTLFNHFYPLVYKGASYFSGNDASLKLLDTIRKAKTDPMAKKRLIDFVVAEKGLTNTTITEASRFGSAKTNQTYNRFSESLKSENLSPKLKKWLKEYGISTEINLAAGQEWQRQLNLAEKKANKMIPATMPYYFDPDKQSAFQLNQQSNDQQNDDNDPLGIR